MAGYAVVDIETTGLFPGGHDRIVEVAVVQVSLAGLVESSWTTLLNPGRDLGPQHIHGIPAADVLDAPTFDEVAGALAQRLAGRVFVAHNASFDARFIANEYAWLGYDVPLVPQTSVCTMRWASHLIPEAPRTLAGCCERAGITLENAHAALVDATATAALLRHYLRLMGIDESGTSGRLPMWSETLELAETVQWPTIPVLDVTQALRGDSDGDQVPFLERIVEHLPQVAEPEGHQEYLALLDRALLDRLLSVRERNALVHAAHTLGIDRQTATRLHQEYLRAMATAALDDGEVADAEVCELVDVALLLSLSDADALAAVREASESAACRSGGGAGPATAAPFLGFRLHPGDRVVFTGEMSLPREDWVARTAAVGLVPHPSVTKSVALVVAADPDSLSGKARKAAEYGIPIVTEQAFAGMLGQIG
jgi:DNA polymerase-3 subunit epsilon